MENNLVSIIIPFYNGELYFEETLKSACNQTYKNIEVIVVNDSPNEKSNLLLSELIEKYSFKLIQNEINIGASKSILKGSQFASGQYIAVLGQDDVFYRDKIQKQIDYLERNSKYIACYCGFDQYNQEIDEIKSFDFISTVSKISNQTVFPELYLFNGLCLTLQGLLVEKKIAEELFYSIWMKIELDDWPVHIRLFEQYPDKIGFVQENLFKYRISNSSVSSQKYKIFSMTIQVIANLCPLEYRDEAILKQLRLLGVENHKSSQLSFYKFIKRKLKKYGRNK